MYKMVVSAFDEALIDSEEAIPISTMLRLEEIRKKGILFVIATSRDLQTILDYNKDFPFADYIVCFNGAYVYDVLNKKVIFQKCLGSRNIKNIKELFSKYKLYYSTLDGLYRDDAILKECGDDIYKIEVHGKAKRDILAIIRTLDASNMNITYYERYKGGKFFVEITSGKNTKFTGISKIIRKNKITCEEVLAIGVDCNDVELIEKVGCGISMMNGHRNVRKIAKDITKSNLEKGVEEVIKNYF